VPLLNSQLRQRLQGVPSSGTSGQARAQADGDLARWRGHLL
jgi:hypothetical protein